MIFTTSNEVPQCSLPGFDLTDPHGALAASERVLAAVQGDQYLQRTHEIKDHLPVLGRLCFLSAATAMGYSVRRKGEGEAGRSTGIFRSIRPKEDVTNKTTKKPYVSFGRSQSAFRPPSPSSMTSNDVAQWRGGPAHEGDREQPALTRD
ncbi:hypothetical protein VTO42DRAFT_2963 [Malbranchea cinnamomea]